MVFWAQGWRFDFSERELVATGVISVTTSPPGATIIINGVARAPSPEVLLGIPIGAVDVCLKRVGYQSFCEQALIDPILSYRYHNVHLIPQSPARHALAKEQQILFDPWGRGYVRFYPQMRDALVFDGDRVHFLNTIDADAVYAIAANGNLLSLTQPPFSAFVSQIPNKVARRFSYDNRGYLYFSGNGLFYKDTTTLKSTILQRFDELVEDAYFLPESDSLITVTTTGIYYAHRIGSGAEFLFEKTAESTVHFYPAAEMIVWQNDDEYFSFSFGQKKLF